MAHTGTSYNDAALLQAYYQAWSAKWIDTRRLPALLDRASEVLWIGSYFSLAKPWAGASWTMVDLDRNMLAVGRRILPEVRAVQADIRRLPFSGAFDVIIALGAVTAYLLDDESVACAADSLARSLTSAPHGRLLIDAYDAESIHSTSYFNGEVTWSSESERWARHGKVDPLPGEDGVFAATLTVSRETVQRKESTHFRFMQRAFRSEQLFELLHKQGLRLLASESDPPRGRLYQMYSPG